MLGSVQLGQIVNPNEGSEEEWLCAESFSGQPYFVRACLVCRQVMPRVFSEWNQATGVKTIEYRWKPNESKGCDVEYRNNKANDKKKYKARLVYQTNDEEKDVPNAVISFAAGTNSTTDQIPSCTMVTDISVTRF